MTRFSLPEPPRKETPPPTGGKAERFLPLPAPTRDDVRPAARLRKRRPLAFVVDGPGIAPPVSAVLRQQILARDQRDDGTWCCPYCDLVTDDPSDLHIDHVVARRGKYRRGGTVPSNLQVVCSSCNSSKGARSLEDFLQRKSLGGREPTVGGEKESSIESDASTT